MKLQSQMRVIKLKEHWNVTNNFLVNQITGKISSEGLDTYWKSVDAGIKYNVAKRREFLAKGPGSCQATGSSTQQGVTHQGQSKPYDRPDEVEEFFHCRRNKGQDRFHWNRGSKQNGRFNRFFLPRPRY